MRIPSQFNQDSLYRRGGRPVDSAHGYRRLARLVVGLALVIVLMRQASQPAIYRTFFGPQSAPVGGAAPTLGADATSGRHGLNPSGTNPSGTNPSGTVPVDPAVPVDPEDRRVAKVLVEELLPADQRQWILALSRWQSGRPFESVPSSAQTLLDRIDSLENLGEEQRSAWTMMLESSIDRAAAEHANPSPPTAIDRPRVAALLAALDAAAAARVVDGSVWRGGDFDTFYRYLEQADRVPDLGVATTGVLPLLQQPEVFRNHPVRVQGGVARAEHIDAKENLYGIDGYWQLWLRPSDGADRPLVAIVPTVPPVVESVGPNAVAQQGPQVAVVGMYLKRLAYESAIGADLAPVVIGRLVSAPIDEQETEIALPNETASPTTNQLGLAVIVACLIGVALAAFSMWRTAAMAKRARELRLAYRKEPDEFLEQLGNQVDRSKLTAESADEEIG